MDHMMPGMDGVETTKQLRNAGYTKPIIALTANAIIEQVDFFLKNGFDGFISKPVDLVQLNRILNRWVGNKQSPETIQQAETKIPKNKKQSAISKEQVAESNEEKAAALLSAHFSLFSNVDVHRGIAMTGGTAKRYREVLSCFYKDAQERLLLLQATPDESNLSLFVINVHALKSVAASIGAGQVSALAAELETAGKAGNLALIQEKLGSFIKFLVDLLKGIHTWETAAKEIVDTDIISDAESSAELTIRSKALLRELSAALESNKVNDMDRIFDELKQLPVDTKTKNCLKEICNQVLISEYESAGKIIEVLVKTD
jgi:FixJ family two-component response regulator